MSAELGKCIGEALSGVLTPCGYTSRERLFAHESADVVHLVQLQGSGTNTGLSCKYTVNLGIWVPALDLAKGTPSSPHIGGSGSASSVPSVRTCGGKLHRGTALIRLRQRLLTACSVTHSLS